MDPIPAAKKEQPKEVVQPQSEGVVEQPSAPEVSPVVEVEGKGVEVAEVTDATEAAKTAEEVKEQEQMVEQPQVVEQTPPSPPPTPVVVAKPVKDRFTQELEEVLEEDLKELYMAMPKEKQAEFRQKGEETLSAVRELVRAAHVNVKKIFQLIRDWLKMIPGVNRYFLEQEAKIKTDKIILVSEEEKKRGSQL